jgi:hypothetical protein
LTRFQRVLWAWHGGDPEEDSTGVTLRALKLLDIICRILELAECPFDASSGDAMRNLKVCRKIYSRALRSSEEFDPSVSLADVRNALHFTYTAARLDVSGEHTSLWYRPGYGLGTVDSHSPEDFDWLVDYYLDIYSGPQEVAFVTLLLLSIVNVRCIPANQHQFIESLVACMGTNMPVHLRYAALRATHIVQEEIASIDAIDAELRDMVLTKLSPAILTTVCLRPGTTLANHPRHLFDYDCNSCYLELIFALARNSNWHAHLIGDHHIDRCISMIAEYCKSYTPHSFYLSGILLRSASGQLSVASLDVITEQQWWDMMRSAWHYANSLMDDIHCFEFLPVLVEDTKKHMQNASKDELKELVEYVDNTLGALEWRHLEQGEGGCVVVAVKEFRIVVSDMFKKSVNSEGVNSP